MTNRSLYIKPHWTFLLFFMFMIWLSNLLIVSIVAFFHFLLDYNMLMIESWIFNQGWEILGLCFVVSLVVVCKFLYLKTDERYPFRTILIEQIRTPRSQTLIGAGVVLTFLIYLSGLVPNENITTADVPKLILGTMFSVVTLCVMAIFIISNDRILPLNSRAKALRNLLFPTLLLGVCRISFLHAESFGFVFWFNLTVLCFLVSSRLYLTEILVLSLGVIAPGLIFFGMDPIWGSEYSPYLYQDRDFPFYFLGLLVVYSGYLWFSLPPLLLGQEQER